MQFHLEQIKENITSSNKMFLELPPIQISNFMGEMDI